MKIFIGYDSREREAYDVCRWSMLRHNHNLDIVPLVRDQLPTVSHSDGSTEFTYTRFLVPYLMDYHGWAMFCDCDFLWQCDPLELLSYVNNQFAVAVVKHQDYQPHSELKMDGVKQTSYPKKNWSSLILWNCEHVSNRIVTPMIIRNSTPSWLHQFGWLHANQIGALPTEYNWLAGYYTNGCPKAIHYTDGGPWFDDYKDCAYAQEWLEAYNEMKTKPLAFMQ